MAYGGIDWMASSRSSADQLRHVVALEGVDVPGEQSSRSSSLSWRSRSGGRVAAWAARVARARWRALLTDATLVSSSSATSAAGQRRTSRRISTARCLGGRCCKAATNASRIVSRSSATSAGSPSGDDPGVGDGQQPGVLGHQGAQEGRVGRRRRPQIHGPGPALLSPQHVQADVGGDAVQPGPEGGPALEGVERPPGPDHGLLDGVLGLEAGTQHSVAVAGQLAAVGLQLLARGP